MKRGGSPLLRKNRMRHARWLSVLIVAALGAAFSWPPTKDIEGDSSWQCTVKSVHDGDSMRVQCPGSRGSVRLRMHQIDAPELEQAYGRQARAQLRSLCPTGTKAYIRVHGTDQYDRLLGDVRCGDKDVNREMVVSGAAWAYDRHLTDPSLLDAQTNARRQRRGLWAAGNAEPPWEWRRQQRRD